MNNIKLHNGDSAEILKQYPDNHFDSVVTDPPYGIEFLAKEWDKNTGPIEVWRECLRVLKPGGHLLAFSAPRKYHRLATNLEDIGFEIRDQIMWIYGSGFPKSHNVGNAIDKLNGAGNRGHAISSGNRFHPTTGEPRPNGEKLDKYEARTEQGKGWEGWGTALKPAHEPIVMARKPFKGTVAQNVLEWGTGAINIDDTRISATDLPGPEHYSKKHATGAINGERFNNTDYEGNIDIESISKAQELGRFPSNVIMSEEEGKVLDDKTGIIKSVGGKRKKEDGEYNAAGYKIKNQAGADCNLYVNEPLRGASKYFYCPKVSRKERNMGFDLKSVPVNEYNDPTKVKEHPLWDPSIGTNVARLQAKVRQVEGKGNTHPTVKPVALMKYLVTLVTPKGGKVLDPFNGSGSTGMAVKEFGGEYVGIDLNKDYIEIAKKRIKAWEKK